MQLNDSAGCFCGRLIEICEGLSFVVSGLVHYVIGSVRKALGTKLLYSFQWLRPVSYRDSNVVCWYL